MKPIVIFNQRAGSIVRADAPITADTLRAAFAETGMSVDVRGVPGDAVDAAVAEAIAARPDAIIAGGGDGTIATAAARLVDTGLPLGVLPLGTLNHFARDLGLPGEWREAIPLLASSTVRRVDVAEVNGHIFINNCSLGSYAEAVRRRDRLRRDHGHGKWRAMVLAAWSVFRDLRRSRFHVASPEGDLAIRAPFLLVANNCYAGHVLDACLRPRLDDGRLWIYSTRVRSRPALVRLALQSLIRPLGDADSLEVHDRSDAVITVPQGSIPIAADGELLKLKPPLHFRSRPGALHVLAPSAPAANADQETG